MSARAKLMNLNLERGEPPKVTPGDLIGSIVLMTLLHPLFALMFTWCATTVWEWFLSPTYGTGPSKAAWFGLSSLVTLARYRVSDGGQRTRTLVFHVVERSVTQVVDYAMIMAAIVFTGYVLGWMS